MASESIWNDGMGAYALFVMPIPPNAFSLKMVVMKNLRRFSKVTAI